MSIVISKNNSTVKILLDTLISSKDIKLFIDSTKDKELLYEISILNIYILSKEIVTRLSTIKKNSKISTNEKLLFQYLQEFEIDTTYLSKAKNIELTSQIGYIGIGGSAGSLEKIFSIIENLPKSNISIFIVIHQKANMQSNLDKLIQNKTAHYDVVFGKSDIKVMPATIYIAPPGKHMIVSGGYLFLLDTEQQHFSRPSISILFNSLAKEYGKELLAILVCGYGHDGSDSMKILKQNQSVAIIEEPDECEAKIMLQSAIETSYHHQVLSLKNISQYIQEHIEYDFEINTERLDIFLEEVYEKYGYDYRSYYKTHIQRRIEHFCSIFNISGFSNLRSIVLSDQTMFEKLFLNISINVTTFFRNPNVFKELSKNVFPKLDSYPDIKIWCAGCSSGEEPYSVAIALHEAGLLNRSIIYATDMNPTILKKAKNGLYSNKNFELFMKHYYESGGGESFESYFNRYNSFVEVKSFIKEKILFFEHNLATDDTINQFQLIFCRNVIIYFDEELKNNVFNLFDRSLERNGFLVLGESETLDKSFVNYNTINAQRKVYQKK